MYAAARAEVTSTAGGGPTRAPGANRGWQRADRFLTASFCLGAPTRGFHPSLYHFFFWRGCNSAWVCAEHRGSDFARARRISEKISENIRGNVRVTFLGILRDSKCVIGMQMYLGLLRGALIAPTSYPANLSNVKNYIYIYIYLYMIAERALPRVITGDNKSNALVTLSDFEIFHQRRAETTKASRRDSSFYIERDLVNAFSRGMVTLITYSRVHARECNECCLPDDPWRSAVNIKSANGSRFVNLMRAFSKRFSKQLKTQESPLCTQRMIMTDKCR